MPKVSSASISLQTGPACHSEGAKRPKNLKKSEILRCAQNDNYELIQSAMIFSNSYMLKVHGFFALS
jgi:hypothetical protein